MRSYFALPREERAQTRVPKTDFNLDDSSIMAALGRLFRGKCAFCEGRKEVQPYLFRPAYNASPQTQSGAAYDDEVGHLYYAWLSLAWENIFPICSDCRPYEEAYFPIIGERCPIPSDLQIDQYVQEGTGLWRDYPIRERARLLDPTDRRIYFHKHLEPSISGWLKETSAEGRDTIEYFNLNSGGIVDRRAAAYSDRLSAIFGRGHVDPRDPHYKSIFEFDSLEFGGSWQLLLRQITQYVTNRNGTIRAPSAREMPRFFANLTRDRSFDLDRVLNLLENDPNHQDDSRDHPIVIPSSIAPIVRPPRTKGVLQLESFAITNFKGIQHIDISLPPVMKNSPGRKWTALAPSLLILGENAAGKSSVLEALALALCERSERSLAGPSSDLILDPNQIGATSERPRQAHIQLEFDDGRAGLSIGSQGFVEDGDYLDFHNQMPRVFGYGAFRQYTSASGGRVRRKYSENLFRSDLLLPNPENWLLDLDDAVFNEVARALRIIISGEATYGFIERDFIARRCYLVSPIERSGQPSASARTPFGAVSSGFRSILAMACDIFRGLLQESGAQSFERLENAQAVVLIDEVEAHLHPRWKMRVMAGFREALPNVTFIATTHDPLCLRSMEDVEVCVVQRVLTDEEDYPTRVEKLEQTPFASTMTVEQLLTSDLFQLLSTDNADLDLALAKMADEKLNGPSLGLTEYERLVIETHERDVERALPIGSSMAHRMVQEAVADFLRHRASQSFQRRRELRDATKKRILQALGENFDETR